MTEKKLPIIGRERMLVNKLAKRLHASASTRGNYTALRETARGIEFEIEPFDGSTPTNRVLRVTVELDRVDGLTT